MTKYIAVDKQDDSLITPVPLETKEAVEKAVKEYLNDNYYYSSDNDGSQQLKDTVVYVVTEEISLAPAKGLIYEWSTKR